MKKKSKKQQALELAVLSLLAVPVFAVNSAEAAEAEEADKSRDIVVTASKMEMEIKAEPAAVEVITAEDIRRLGATNVRDALALASNINVSKAGMVGNAVMVRGNNTNHTLIMVDGMRMASEDTPTTENYYKLAQINVNDIERIEIVRGSGSVLYGSDAIGGVINIITRHSDKPSYAVGISTGTEDINNYYNFNFGKEGRWTTSLNMQFSKIRRNNHEDVGSGVYPMYGTRQYYDFKAVYDFENAQKNKLSLGFDYQTDKLETDSTSGVSTNYDNKRYGINLGFTGQSEKNNYELRTYFYDYTKESAGSSTPNDAKYNNWVLEARDTLYADEQHTITYGGEYARNSYEGTRLGRGVKKDYSFSTYAGYIQDNWQLNDRLLLIPAVRYEHNSMFGSSVTPKIGATYSFSPNTRLKLNYGRGYKAPTISELYMDWYPGVMPMRQLGDPNLQPEKSVNFDIGIEADNDKSFGKLTYFRNSVSNLIEMQQVSAARVYPVIYQWTNVGRAQIEGVEAEYGYHLNENWSIKVTHNYLDAKDTSNNSRLSSRAKNTTIFQLVYDDKQADNFTATIWDKIYGDYHYQGADYSYNVLGISLNKNWNGNFSTYLSVENLLNRKVDPLYEWGTSWRLGAEWKF